MGDPQTPGPGPADPLPKFNVPAWAALAVPGLILLAVGWWLLSGNGEPAAPTSPTVAWSPAPPSTPATTPPPSPEIDVEAQAELLAYQGKIDALICRFQLLGTKGFSAKKLLDGQLTYELELNVRAGADVIRFRGLRFGDETTDGQVSKGTGEPDRIDVYQTAQGQEGPFGCELDGATVEGGPVQLGGTTSVTAE